MAENKFPKGSDEWQMFVDFWRVVQKYWIAEDNDEYWKALIKEVGDFNKTHKTRFASKLMTAFYLEQEAKAKGEQVKLDI